jgi:cyclohexyl-isocyanide hydratase
MAGLLKGKRATTHWAYTDLLANVGATFEKSRIVWDGNLVTAGGVTSGIDFALRMVAAIAGDDVAQTIQLGIEYDPDPPFASGSPDRAAEPIRTRVEARFADAREAYRAALAG